LECPSSDRRRPPERFSLGTEAPLTAELEEERDNLLRKYNIDRQMLSPHAPEEPSADDGPSMLVLGATISGIGSILVV
jgi:hypothetical protein